MKFVDSQPYPWPFDGDLRPDNTVFLVIDMQVDFCGHGGYVDQMGYDLSLTRAPIQPIKSVLAACRALGYHVMHTREGHRPDLSDLPDNKKWRSERIGAGIGSQGPCGRVLTRGEPGWELIPELAPAPGEVVIDKPGKGSFYATDLELVLRVKGVRNIVLAGITTDVCVHTTMRHANDMGFECLLLSDCTGATDPSNHAAALQMIKMQGGVFGAVATSTELIAAMKGGDLHAPTGMALNGNGAARTTPSPVPPPAAADRVVSVEATPYAFELPLRRTALVMIDFQRDFMCPGGFGTALNQPVERLRVCIEPAQALLAAARRSGLTVVHTLEAHLPDLSDLHHSKLTRGNPPEGMRIGDKGEMGRILVRGEYGNEIIEELAPVDGELALFKPGKGMFYNTNVETWLKQRNITHLIFAGVTTEVCVQTSMREANDRGFESLLATDATESFFPDLKAAAIKMMTSQCGIVGWAAPVDAIVKALE